MGVIPERVARECTKTVIIVKRYQGPVRSWLRREPRPFGLSASADAQRKPSGRSQERDEGLSQMAAPLGGWWGEKDGSDSRSPTRRIERR